MVYYTGDTHGDFKDVRNFAVEHELTENDTIVVLGDAGVNYYLGIKDMKTKQFIRNIKPTIFCIHGNHEERPYNIKGYTTKEWNGGTVWYEEAYPNILFAKDGEVYDLDGKKSLVIGGAYSVDKEYRLIRHWHWFESEQPTDEIKKEVIEKCNSLNWEVEQVLTHTCPLNLRPVDRFLSCVDQSRVDSSTENFLQYIFDELKFKRWLCGHWHIDRVLNGLKGSDENNKDENVSLVFMMDTFTN